MAATLGLTLVIVALSVIGLAIGGVLGRKPLKGSCGGLSCHVCAAKGLQK